MAIASFNFGQKSNLPSTTTNGALYFLTDSGELYYGNGSSGVKISDIEIVDTYDDLEDITTPLSNKFYYVIEDTVIYKYQDNDWVAISGGGGGGSVNVGVGLAKSGSTIKAKLSTETALDVASSSGTIVAGKIYSVNVDNSGYLCVAVPWENTTYQSKSAENGGTDVSLVTTGEKYIWNNKTSNTGTVTSVAPGDGLTGDTVTTSGTIKANLLTYTKSSLDSASPTAVTGKQYAVHLDNSGYLSVNVPWDNTTYESKTAASGGTDLSLVTTGEKYEWNNKTSNTGTVTSVTAGAGLSGGTITGSGTLSLSLEDDTASSLTASAMGTTANRQYAVGLDAAGKLSVNIPWENTTYSSQSESEGGTDLSLVTTGEKYAWNHIESNPGTVTEVTAGDGLNGGSITSSGTIKANLTGYTKSSLASASVSTTANRQYAVNLDSAGYLSVNVPWDNTTYESKSAASAGTDLSLVTTGEKYIWNNKTSNTGTVTEVTAGIGLTGGPVTTSGTIKANLKSETAATYDSNTITNTQNKQYAVVQDKSGYLSVNVPWDNTTYESKTAASGGTDLSLVTTGEKYEWNNKTSNTGTVTSVAASTGLVTASGSAVSTSGTIKANLRSETKLTNDSAAATETSGRIYPVALDKTGYLAVNVPWTDNNTTYANGTGISIGTGNAINHTNSVTAGTRSGSSGTLSNGGSFNIPSITWDAQGHITSTTYTTCTLPTIAGTGSWTGTSGSLSVGTTAYRFTNPKGSASVTVEVYCENTGATVSYSGSTYSGTAPVALTGIYVTASYIYINFASLTVATSFKCLVW